MKDICVVILCLAFLAFAAGAIALGWGLIFAVSALVFAMLLAAAL